MDTYDDTANTEETLPPQRSVLDVGMTLRRAREGMGLSAHDIANRIKFSPRQVEALEANDFENLPRTTFLRGFVRSYARVLQLDEAPLIAALPHDPVTPVVTTKARSLDIAFPSLLSLQRVNLLWLTGAIGVALLLGLFVFMGSNDNALQMAEVVVEPVSLPASDAVATDVSASAAQIATAEEMTSTPAEQPGTSKNQAGTPIKQTNTSETRSQTPVAQAMAPSAAQTETPESKKVADSGFSDNLSRLFKSTVSTETQIEPAASAAAAETQKAAKPEIPLEILKRRPMHFVFNEASWAEVKDVRGNLLLSRNVPRGGEKWIGGPGRAPYAVSIKNPSKVSLYYKGKQIDLSPYAEMEMAHLTVE